MTENNDSRNTITYDDDWKSVSYSEYPKVSDELDLDEEDVNSLSAENSDERKILETACDNDSTCVLYYYSSCGFLLNLFGGEVYAATREWYYSNLEKSVVFDTGDNKIDLSNLFTATSDEVSSAEH